MAFFHSLFRLILFSSLLISIAFRVNAQFGISKNCDGGKLIVPLSDTNLHADSEWILEFSDDFNGDSLNLNLWRNVYEEGQGFGEYSTYLTLDNVEVYDGLAHLLLKRERVERLAVSWMDSSRIMEDGQPNLRWYNFTSGLIRSYKTFLYGYFEASCKVPNGKGYWPAMWLYGSGGENNHDPNTVPGEIDVFEFWKNDFKSQNTNIHFGNEACLQSIDGSDFSQDFHTFAVLWEPYKIEWFVDGEIIRTYNRYYQSGKEVGSRLYAWYLYEEAPFPVYPLLIYFDLFIDNHAGYRPNENTVFPASLEIDWVKFYTKKCYLDRKEFHIFSFSLYPNPASESFYYRIFSNNEINHKLIIYNHLGVKKLETDLYQPEGAIMTSGFEKGVYFVKIFGKTNGEFVTNKLIIN